MAEKVPTVSDVLKIVEEKLKCAICLQNFTQPKSLPCLHVFCKSCLEALLRLPAGGGQMVNCPVCRSPAPLSKDGISGFPDQFHFSDYADMHRMLKKMADQQVTCEACKKNPAQGFCQQCERFICQKCIDIHGYMEDVFSGHKILSINQFLTATSQLKPLKKPAVLLCPKHKNPLTVYCHSPCDQLICHDCTIRIHKDHECDPISEESVFQKYKQEIDDGLLSAKECLSFIHGKIQSFEKRAAEISTNRDQVKEEIETTGNRIIEAVKRSVVHLKEKADMAADQKLRFMSLLTGDAHLTAAMVQSCVEYAEEKLRMGSDQQILASKKQMMDRLRVVTSHVKGKERENLPTEEPNIKLVRNPGKSTDIGAIDFSMLTDKCKLSGSGTTTTRIQRPTKFTLAVTPTPGSAPLSLPTSLVSCQLSAPEAACPTDCSIVETAPGKYEVSYTPVSCGPHQLRVRVGDVDIPGSPFTIQVKSRGTPLCSVGGLNRPWGVAFRRDGCVVVTEHYGNCVTLLNEGENGRKSFDLKGSQNQQLDNPTGVVVTQDNKIIVCSSHHIQKFDVEGKLLTVAGGSGSGQLQFYYPGGIAVDKNYKIWVADRNNHCIRVLNPDFSFAKSFGVQGSQPGQFQKPFCVATDSKGMVYVTDNGNHRVQKFTPEGEFVSQFGKEGGREGEFKYPCGIAVDTTTDTVYVTSKYKVSAFTIDGRFRWEFGKQGSGEGDLQSPFGITVDESTGDLYVCDFNNDRLVVY